MLSPEFIFVQNDIARFLTSHYTAFDVGGVMRANDWGEVGGGGGGGVIVF